MNKKAINIDLNNLTETGEFEGYASIYNNVDYVGDIMEPGAFKNTLQNTNSVVLLWQHDPEHPIGTVELSEDNIGLKVKGKLNLEVAKAKEAYALLKQKAINGMSIGYDTIKDTMISGIRHLKEVSLWEVSLVTFPANALATVTEVKNVEHSDVVINETKDGKVISANNMKKLEQCLTLLQEIMGSEMIDEQKSIVTKNEDSLQIGNLILTATDIEVKNELEEKSDENINTSKEDTNAEIKDNTNYIITDVDNIEIKALLSDTMKLIKSYK